MEILNDKNKYTQNSLYQLSSVDNNVNRCKTYKNILLYYYNAYRRTH